MLPISPKAAVSVVIRTVQESEASTGMDMQAKTSCSGSSKSGQLNSDIRISSNRAGQLLAVSFEDALRVIEADFLCGVKSSLRYQLNAACEPCTELIEYMGEVLMSGRNNKAGKDWRCLMNKRIGISYKLKDPRLVWLDDKVEQVAATAACFEGRELHLPILAHAKAGCASAEADLRTAVRKHVQLGTAMVVKPRHGSNSKQVSLWPQPRESDEPAILQSVDSSLQLWDKSFKKESWNQNAVPKGALLQPLYKVMQTFVEHEGSLNPKLLRPLELKVQVLFGETVGACLNTHPTALFVTRNGCVHLWDQAASGFLKRHHGLSEPLPQVVLDVLLAALSQDWPMIRADSEHLARSIGLDELRVDWLLGDPDWGPRVGELTYMGTFCLDVLPVSLRLARAFSAAHLGRLGHPVPEHCF
jgi:hypothetical protein